MRRSVGRCGDVDTPSSAGVSEKDRGRRLVKNKSHQGPKMRSGAVTYGRGSLQMEPASVAQALSDVWDLVSSLASPAV